MLRHSFLLPLLLLLTGTSLACSELPPEETPANVAPRARLTSPVWVAAGFEASLDGSESFDPDGTIVAYRFLFGDGTPELVSASSRVTHTYGSTGSFTVWLTVVDGQGAEARAAHGIGVTLDPPAACQAAGDCEATERCAEDGLCYRDGPGDACATDAECVGTGRNCHAGVCTDSDCQSDLDCAMSEVCRVGRCYLEAADGGSEDAG